MMKVSGTALALIGAVAMAQAQEHRQLDAHAHGHGALNIAIEGASFAMELEVPAADIVGFEHAAESAADREALEQAEAQLARPLEVFALPEAAGCVVAAASVAVHGAAAHGHDDLDEDHAGHDDDGHHDEDHADHDEEHHDEDHAGHEDEHEAHGGHGEHAEAGETHSEFHAEYALTCSDPSAITEIGFPYFGLFPNAEELEVQMITDTGAHGAEVSRDAPSLSLQGML